MIILKQSKLYIDEDFHWPVSIQGRRTLHLTLEP
jgi:hypothetical protein